MPKLKVYCTPIGFHDAYVAAPSQKAALAAWGSDANLFARGVAEQVTDPARMEAPLADPGAVIKVARGSFDEHRAKARGKSAKARPPSRADLRAAEAALATLKRNQAAERAELKQREDRERRSLSERQNEALAAAEAALQTARRDYERAVAQSKI